MGPLCLPLIEAIHEAGDQLDNLWRRLTQNIHTGTTHMSKYVLFYKAGQAIDEPDKKDTNSETAIVHSLIYTSSCSS